MAIGMIRQRSADSVFRPKRVGLVACGQTPTAHLVQAANVFARAALDDGYGGRIPCYELCTVTADEEEFQAREIPNGAPRYDTVLVTGGKEILNPALSEPIRIWLHQIAPLTRRVAAMGPGVYALADTGLLHRRNIAVDRTFLADFSRRYPATRLNLDRSIVHDGRYITASGPDAGTNLPLTLISQDYGPAVAHEVASQLRCPARVPAVSPSPRRLDDQLVNRFGDLVGWVLRNLDRDLSLNALARKAGMSPGHLHKSFKRVFGVSPRVFVSNIRFNEARRVVRKQSAVGALATSFGYLDSRAFQRAYERRFGKIFSKRQANQIFRHGIE